MITAYHRPATLDEALTLLTQPNVIPLGGGTLLASRKPMARGATPVEVVDLQSLSLDAIKKQGNQLEIGATATLQRLLESEDCPEALKPALKLEAPLNLRNAATVAGTLVSCDGRSTFTAMMLAMDARLEIKTINRVELVEMEIDARPPKQDVTILGLGEFLPLRAEQIQGKLITSVTVPINVKIAFDYVSRTPADKPIVCAALARWNSGRTRLVLGGYGKSPMLAMDGTESEGIEAAARNAGSLGATADEWGSAEYRMDIAATLAKRCLENLA